MDKICYIPGHIPVPGASITNRVLWTPGSTITVQNLNLSDAMWHDFIEAASEWTKYANLQFMFLPRGKGTGWIKVAYQPGGGSWSYLGTDCISVPRGSPSMCFGWQDRATYLHETGHALGLNHSHTAKNMPFHFDEAAVIKEFSSPPNSWSEQVIRSNILNRVTGDVTENFWTQKDVMLYFFPARLIKERVQLEPGTEISENEKKLVAQMYPFPKKDTPDIQMM